jgi:hypothetical protein
MLTRASLRSRPLRGCASGTGDFARTSTGRVCVLCVVWWLFGVCGIFRRMNDCGITVPVLVVRNSVNYVLEFLLSRALYLSRAVCEEGSLINEMSPSSETESLVLGPWPGTDGGPIIGAYGASRRLARLARSISTITPSHGDRRSAGS